MKTEAVDPVGVCPQQVSAAQSGAASEPVHSPPQNPTEKSVPPAAASFDLPEEVKREIQCLTSNLRALAVNGYAPNRDEFVLAAGVSARLYEKYFGSYEVFVTASGLKTATQRRFDQLWRKSASRRTRQSRPSPQMQVPPSPLNSWPCPSPAPSPST
ncbi:MAG: hypothetical protein JSS51_12870 [Planctomycetes bacterium]|nr:hypothetical protein [Planctomycetota bacterium]